MCGSSGNTDMVYFYPEFTARPESITSERLGERIEECLRTNYGHVCAQMHILVKPQPRTYMHTTHGHEYTNTFKVVCVFETWQAAGKVRVSMLMRKKH